MIERCAVLARAADEPLAGTAPVATRWAGLEHRAAWPDSVDSHPDPAVAGFVRRAAARGWRVVLIRRPGRRTATGRPRLILADTTTALATTLRIDGPGALADVPLPEAGAPLPGTPVDDTPLLVCTHGRRDRCCAIDGRALAGALVESGEPDVWECTHLGGHRFAPTALVLPTGYLYGRLDPETAATARKTAAAGEVQTALCRGRSTWSHAGQVAELAVREATGLRDANALRVVATDHGAEVHHLDNGRRWAVDLAHDGGGAGPCSTSCGVAVLRREALRVTAVRPLP
ncbi:sucrase ferredoxin [Pseudonocardia humida]|uniref:Sucrase ferredoxin n=1 Tax=Pseudonocardia humida TaxID=2800819 RepID=A0ABT1A361_9PSEU|nr:sucrase ferredoxin [Pseudonocardia humida]MCO1657446.1 sucrase ferredoxin [Pseudonocardia humida]